MLSTKQGKLALKLLIPLLIALLSAFILVRAVPETKFVQESLESLNRSNNTVMDFAGTTMSMSLALSAFPDDFATPLANTLSGMDQYYVFILIALFVERLVVVQGIRAAFRYLIPCACGLHALSTVFKSPAVRSLSYRIAVLALAVILAVPCSTHLAEAMGKEYMAYVDQTIAESAAGAEKINEATASEGEGTLFERLSDAFSTAIRSVNDMMQYFKNAIRRCINSIAILIVTTFVIPLLTFLVLERLLNSLFKFSIPLPHWGRRPPKESDGRGEREDAP